MDTKISENILKYYQKSEVVFKCFFVIRNDLNMIKKTGGLKEMFAQLSGTTKFRKKWPKKMKIFKNDIKNPKSFLNASLLSEII